jgi:Spy/CpxP family protein refolding chaperone
MRELAEQTADMDRRDRAGRVRELMAEMRSEIEASLTDAQKQEFDTKLAEARERLRGAGPGAGAAPGANADPVAPGAAGRGGVRMVERLESAIAQLDLSAEQKSQAGKIFADLRAVADRARADVAGGADPQDVREQVREALTGAREQLGAMLEPEQRQKLRELMQPDGADPRRAAGDGKKPKKDKN